MLLSDLWAKVARVYGLPARFDVLQGDCPGIAEDTGAGWLAYVHQFKVRGTHGPSPSRGSVSVRGTEIHPSADV